MKAPEKIYLIRNISTSTALNTTNDCHEKYLQEWYKGREKDADIEYTRTDVFIKKAEKFFTEKFEVEDYNDNIDINGSPIFNYGRFIDNFVKYMKGE